MNAPAPMSRQQEVLAHLGGALLAAQIVERFLALMLKSPDETLDERALEEFAAKSKPARLQALAQMLQTLRDGGRSVPALDTELRRFLKERNKLVHRFHALGRWNFRNDRDCDACVTFLRGFIDRAASIQHLFVSALSAKDVHYGGNLSKADADRYAHDSRTVYSPLSIRWTKRVGA
jgi:hypothetical protein